MLLGARSPDTPGGPGLNRLVPWPVIRDSPTLSLSHMHVFFAELVRTVWVPRRRGRGPGRFSSAGVRGARSQAFQPGFPRYAQAPMTDTPSATPDFQVARTRCPHHFTATRFGLGLAVLLAVAFSDVLFGWRSFFTRDFANFGYPLAYHVQQSYRAGEVPLWNPYNVAGLPFLAQWNTLALYPLSLVYVLLPLPWSLNFFNLLHLFLGGLGMFCLARGWLRNGPAAGVAGGGCAFRRLLVRGVV